ncbi:suppressor protein SRP40-like [Aristolochia californica]|uniref:suppressor protein SRP40-like n=1 Tax=Aristolochia californica TaxID=171875 RepID=UPI0035DF6517
MRQDFEENSDMKSDKIDDEEDWEDAEKRKHRSTKSRKYCGADEAEERDSTGKKKGSDKDGRKRSGGSSRADSGDDDDDYDVRRESRSKAAKRSQEDHGEKKSGSTGPERELDNSRKSRPDEIDRNSSKKASTKASSHENSQGRSRSKQDTLMDGEVDRIQDKDSRYSERKDSGREKGHGSREPDRNSRRRWDEPERARKPEDSGYPDKADLKSGKGSDNKQGTSRERNLDGKIESSEAKNRGPDSNSEKGGRSSNRDERRLDGDTKGRGKSEAHEEDNRLATREERTQGGKDDKQRRVREDVESSGYRPSSRVYEEKGEKQRSQRDSTHGSRDDRESWENTENESVPDQSQSVNPSTSSRHRKRSEMYTDDSFMFLDKMKEIAAVLREAIKPKIDKTVGENWYEALTEIPNLSIEMKFRAPLLLDTPMKRDMFTKLPVEERLSWLKYCAGEM